MTREEVEELLVDSNPEALFLDGFDDAIIGLAERPNLGPVVAYDESKIIDILAETMEVGEGEEDDKYSMAIEYYEFNIKGSWLGEGTPIIITTIY